MRNRKPSMLFAAMGIVLAFAMFQGCAAKKNSTPQPLPTNAIDTADANAFRVIADAHAFITSIRTSVTNGDLKLTATQKQAFNDTVAAYNTAYAVGMAYHNRTNTNAQSLNAATSNLSTKLTAASALITAPTK